MGMVVRSNIMAQNANRQLGINNSSVSKNLEKLSSGFKINRAGDDASGLAISEKMKAQIKGLETASANSQDGISLVQTAEGALTEVHDMLNRMVELTEKAANGTLEKANANGPGTDRQAIQEEMDALATEIDRISKSTNFNNIKLLDGSLATGGAAAAPGGTYAVTNPTSGAATVVDGITGAVNSSIAFNVAGFAGSADAAGKVKLTVAGQDIEIAVTQGMTDTDFAAAIAGKTFTYDNKTYTAAAAGTTVTFTANDQTAITGGTTNGVVDAAVSITAIQPGATSAAFKAGDSFEYDFSAATNMVANDTITIGGETFKAIAAGGAAPAAGEFVIGGNTADTVKALAAAMAANTDLNAKFDITEAGGKITLKAKADAGATDTAPGAAVAGGALPADWTDAPTKTAGSSGLTLQIGDTNDSFNKLTISIDKMDMASLFAKENGMTLKTITDNGETITSLDVSDPTKAGNALTSIKNVINTVSSQRAKLGAAQNRLEHTINNLDVAAENMSAANSRIRDTDMAKQMMDYTKMNVLTQAAQAMLAQANQQPQSILQLLK